MCVTWEMLTTATHRDALSIRHLVWYHTGQSCVFNALDLARILSSAHIAIARSLKHKNRIVGFGVLNTQEVSLGQSARIACFCVNTALVDEGTTIHMLSRLIELGIEEFSRYKRRERPSQESPPPIALGDVFLTQGTLSAITKKYRGAIALCAPRGVSIVGRSSVQILTTAA